MVCWKLAKAKTWTTARTIGLLTALAAYSLATAANVQAQSPYWTSYGPANYIGALAINPTTPTTLYAGGGSDVYRSTDGGNTWSALGSGFNNVYALAIDPQTPTTLYAGTYGGVFKSTNSGNTWSAVNTGLTSVYAYSLAIDPQTPSTIYVGTLDAGVFKSTNEGGNWSAVNAGLDTTYQVRVLAINPTTPTTLYAGFGNNGVFKSINGGANWTAANTGLPSSPGAHADALAIDPNTPTTLYAALTNQGVYKSTNAGNNWSLVNTVISSVFFRALVIDPTTTTTLYLATWSGVFKSTNGGVNWSAVNAGLTNTTVDALAINPATPATLYAGTEGGVFDTRRQVSAACGVNGDCPSGNCVDGICCDSGCTGTCQSCALATTGQPNGTCASVVMGLQTSNNCNTASFTCNGSTGPGSCTVRTPQGQACGGDGDCVAGNCVDGICCDQTCTDTCESCAAAKTGLADGTCGPVNGGQPSSNSCTASGMLCNGASGLDSCVPAACPANASGGPACVCDAGYTGTLAWDGSAWTGVCTLADCPANASGGPNCTCDSTYTGVLSWNGSSWDGTCVLNCANPPGDPANGTYASCNNTSSGGTCALTCDSGYSKSANALCTAGSWSTETCDLAACPANASGAPTCTCDVGWAGTLTWNGTAWTGTCVVECATSPANPANGTYALCDHVSSGTRCTLTCDAGYTRSGNALCTDGSWSAETCDLAACPANAGGAPNCACNTDYTGTISWNGNSWNGSCKLLNGRTCTSNGQCDAGNCVDGVCCNSSCGGGATNDCQACSIAAGAVADGTCGPSVGGTVCRQAGTVCDIAETCSGSVLTCPADAFAPRDSQPAGCDDIHACNGAGLCGLATGQSCGSDVQCASNFCVGGICATSNGQACTSGPECGSGFCVSNICCDSACDTPFSDSCPVSTCATGICEPVDCESHDTVLQPLKPITVTIPAGTTQVTKALSVKMRNADPKDEGSHIATLSVDDSDCGGNVATLLADPSTTVSGGGTAKAKVELTVRSNDFTGYPKAPHRCTLWFTVTSSLVFDGSYDPRMSNNVVPMQLDVIDANDGPLPAAHETTLATMRAVNVTISAGLPSATKQVKPALGNADEGESPGDVVSAIAADGTCPAGTVGAIDHDGSLGLWTTVKGGGKAKTMLPLQLQSADLYAPNKLSPYRCVATVTVTGPGPDTVSSNNTVQLVIDVLDKNDH